MYSSTATGCYSKPGVLVVVLKINISSKVLKYVLNIVGSGEIAPHKRV
jgi:hypothetical protein